MVLIVRLIKRLHDFYAKGFDYLYVKKCLKYNKN